jgi:hypothetical protein
MNNDNDDIVVAEIKNLPYFKSLKNRLKRKYLAAYARCGNITQAGKIAGCDWRNHYWWLDRDLEYKQAFEKAKEIAGDLLEGQIMDAVMNGDEHPIIWNGVITGKYKRKSDILRMFMMKGQKPQYRDNFSINQFNGPMQLNVKFDSSSVDPLDQTKLVNDDNKE